MSVIGIDPGIHGALAHYVNGGVYDVIDMPTFAMVINKKTRDRLDTVALNNYFALKKMMGLNLVMMEAVGGRPAQSAGAAFVFGYTVGVIFAMCIAHRIPIATVPAAVWKKHLQVPGKKIKGQEKQDPAYGGKIIARADELLPNDRDKWRGKQGGLKVDRAEAALLGFYGERFHMRVPNNGMPNGVAETRMIDTGA